MNLLSPDVEQYWNAVEEQICLKCADGDGAGNCLMPAGSGCELLEYFPLIVGVVNDVYSAKIEDYIWRLRREVCAQCASVQPDSRCHRRDDVDCTLNRFYPLVIGAIESILRQTSTASQIRLDDENLPISLEGEYE
jgi:hypothetical protein